MGCILNIEEIKYKIKISILKINKKINWYTDRKKTLLQKDIYEHLGRENAYNIHPRLLWPCIVEYKKSNLDYPHENNNHVDYTSWK